MATADEEAMERSRGGFGVEEATGSVGAVSVRGKATDALLEFPRTTRVGCVGVERLPPEDRGDDKSREEGGPGPP